MAMLSNKRNEKLFIVLDADEQCNSVVSLACHTAVDLGSLMGDGVPEQLLQRYAQFCDRHLSVPPAIHKNEAFPEHRTNFFQLIHALTVEYFPVFLALP
ncbi:unnamed protein product [Cylicocyclus nassatus]|uniref:Exportin-1 C-terminal domain-containing protein n=1 Tax=Cylicocyclus nassatus TaxID=53992 RepID=A0AA36M413_CYLNA|nr:unnamed protein product [Cylicocyclus nassatus]